MRCLACNCVLTDREASRKYTNWKEMPAGEDQYIMLCNNCLVDTDLLYVENPLANNDEETNDEST